MNCSKKGKCIRQIRHNSQPNKQALITCHHYDSFPIHFNCYKKSLTSKKRDQDTNLSHDNDDIKASKGTKRRRAGRATASTVNNKSKNKVKNDQEEGDEGLIKLI